MSAAAALLDKLEHSGAKFTPLMNAQRSALQAEIAAARHDDATMLAARKQAWDAMRAGQGEQHPLTAGIRDRVCDGAGGFGSAADARTVAGPLIPIVSQAFAENSEANRSRGGIDCARDAGARLSGDTCAGASQTDLPPKQQGV